MADWIRSLFHAAGVSREWHARKSGGYSTTTYCGLAVSGPLEVTQPDRAEREGRCASCADQFAPLPKTATTKEAVLGAKAAANTSRSAKPSRQKPKRRRR